MRKIAASSPAAFAYSADGLRLLQPIAFSMTDQMPIPSAMPSADSRPERSGEAS